jgi:hypothetical protein
MKWNVYEWSETKLNCMRMKCSANAEFLLSIVPISRCSVHNWVVWEWITKWTSPCQFLAKHNHLRTISVYGKLIYLSLHSIWELEQVLYYKCIDNLKFCLYYIIWAISRIMLAYLLAFTTCAFLACGLHLLVFLDPPASPLWHDIIGKTYINFIWNLRTNESFKFILFANGSMRDNLLDRILNVAQSRKQKVQALVGLLHHLDKIFKLVMGIRIFFSLTTP